MKQPPTPSWLVNLRETIRAKAPEALNKLRAMLADESGDKQ